jgi:hypothetical protein
MPAAFAHALTQAYEAKPRGQRYFKKEEVEALVAHLAAMDPQLFQQRPLSDKQVSSVFPRDRVLSLQGLAAVACPLGLKHCISSYHILQTQVRHYLSNRRKRTGETDQKHHKCLRAKTRRSEAAASGSANYLS